MVLFAAPTFAQHSERPFLLQFTSDTALTAGIGLLNNSPIPDNTTEVRIWIGFGVVVPEEMLRLRTDAQGATLGEVLVHFPSDLTYMKAREAAAFRRDVMRRCNRLRKGKETDVCTATFKHAPDWSALYKELVKLGITTLPDESELPKSDRLVFDGVAIVVEVRQGSVYRAYEYSNPVFRSEPEAKAAAQIISTVSDVFRLSSGG